MIIHDIQSCIGCGACVKACSRRNFLLASGEVSLQHEKTILDLIRTRRSIRCYQDICPSKEQIARLLDAARYAPSGHNSQDFGFVVVCGKERGRALGECSRGFYRRLVRLLANPLGRWIIRLAVGKGTFETLTTMTPRLKRHLAIYQESGRIEMVWDAPCLILVHGPDKSDSVVNAVLAGYNIMLQAHAMGLGTCILGLLKAGLEHAGRGLKKAGFSFRPAVRCT